LKASFQKIEFLFKALWASLKEGGTYPAHPAGEADHAYPVIPNRWLKGPLIHPFKKSLYFPHIENGDIIL
jgi:hypothetical protein